MAGLSARNFMCITIACMLLFAPPSEAIQCPDVIKILMPCARYVTGNGGPVPTGCCDAVKGLNRAAAATPDKRSACKCIKDYATNVSGLNLKLVASLPESCGLKLPFVPSPSTDCTRIS